MHSCAVPGDIEQHFSRSERPVRDAFNAVVDAVGELGPVEVLPQRTRVALHVRMSFAAMVPRVRWLDGHLVLARSVPSPRWRRIEVLSPRNVVHSFRLHGPDDVDAEFRAWLAEAYDVGCQRHLHR